MRNSIRLFCLVALIALSIFAQAQTPTATVTLTWTASAAPVASVLRYSIYRTTVPGAYLPTSWIGNSGTGAVLTYADKVTLLATPQTLYYVARTVAIGGVIESANSNEVTVSLPALPVVPAKPGPLTCSITIVGAAVTGTCK